MWGFISDGTVYWFTVIVMVLATWPIIIGQRATVSEVWDLRFRSLLRPSSCITASPSWHHTFVFLEIWLPHGQVLVLMAEKWSFFVQGLRRFATRKLRSQPKVSLGFVRLRAIVDAEERLRRLCDATLRCDLASYGLMLAYSNAHVTHTNEGIQMT